MIFSDKKSKHLFYLILKVTKPEGKTYCKKDLFFKIAEIRYISVFHCTIYKKIKKIPKIYIEPEESCLCDSKPCILLNEQYP